MTSVKVPEIRSLCSSMQLLNVFTDALCNKHCELVLIVCHNYGCLINKLQIKAVLQACVVKKTARCRIVGLMHIGAYTGY